MKFLFVFIILILVGCNEKEYVKNETSFFVMDTYVNIRIYNEDKDEVILEEIEELFNYYHCLTDRYDSCKGVINVYDVNNMDEEYLEIDEELAFLIDYGRQFYDQTDGRLNIMMGDLIDFWKERILADDFIPQKEELLEFTYQDIELLENKISQGVNLDLGSLAKGYAVKKAGELLEKEGYEKYIINAGGQVLVGESYREDAYRIGIKHPIEDGNLLIVNGEGVNVSTSGGYERFFEMEGQRFHHIINPKTLFPADYFLSVSVITEDSLLADALTTALFVMSLEEGKKLLSQYDAEAVWYTKDYQLVRSEGFSQYE